MDTGDFAFVLLLNSGYTTEYDALLISFDYQLHDVTYPNFITINY